MSINNTDEQSAVLKHLHLILPGIPAEIVGNAIAIGELRPDQLAPLVLDWDAIGGYVELRAADPWGHQRNVTDRQDFVRGEPEHIALTARKFLLTHVQPRAGVARLVTVSGDDYEEAVDAINDLGGSTTATVEYLLTQVKDSNFELGDYLLLRSLSTGPHQLHAAIHAGTTYWLQINHQKRLYALHVSLADLPSAQQEKTKNYHHA